MEVDKDIFELINNLTQKQDILKFLHNVGGDKFNPEKSGVLYSGPYWDEREIVAAIKALLVGKWLSAGEYIHQFERKFCRRFNQKNGVMVNSGSSANLVMIGALKKVLKWRDGDEIILSVVGFPTTTAPIVQHNLKPVFIDIEMQSLNFNIDLIEASITSRTRAILISPVLGNSPDMDRLVDIAGRKKIELIMDNCDSLGTRWRGKYLSDYAVASSYSFYPAHHITTAEGGLVSSDSEDVIKVARSLSWWGRDCHCVGAANLLSGGTCKRRFDKWLEGYDNIVDHRYVFTNMGYNLKPLDLQGAIGLVQLEKFDEIHVKRREHKSRIQVLLEKYVSGVEIPGEIEGAETSWFGVPVICPNRDMKRAFVKHLEGSRIQVRNYFAGNLLLHPGYSQLGEYRDYPMANRVLDEVFFIGCAPHYTDEVFDYIENVLENWQGIEPK